MFGQKKKPIKIRFKEVKIQNKKKVYINGQFATWENTDEPFNEKEMYQEKYRIWEAENGIEFETYYELNFTDTTYIKNLLRGRYEDEVARKKGLDNKKRFLEDKEWMEI